MIVGVEMRRAPPPASPDALEAAETRLGVTLPEDYRRFLLEHDGASLEPNSLNASVLSSVPSAGVDVLFGTGDGEATLIGAQRTYHDRMPSEILAVGEAGGGDKICIGVRGEARERVFLWEHEFEADEGEPPTWENVRELASSFAAFLDALRPAAAEPHPPTARGSTKPGFLERLRREGKI